MKNFTIKKYLKSLIFFVLLAQSPWANAYNPAADVNANWSEHSDRLVDKRISDETIIESSTFDPESADNKAFTDNRAGKILSKQKYFQDITYLSCQTPADYTCPPLTETSKALGYRTRINFLDLKNGEIGCSVYKSIDYGQSLNKTTETPIFKKKFINSACVEKYSTIKNIDKSDDIANLIEQNSSFIEDLKQQEYKYDVDYKMNGDDEFLDIADTLDAISTFNPQIIDFNRTLLSKSLKAQDGYSLVPNQIISARLDNNLKSLSEMWNGEGFNSERFIEKEITRNATMHEISTEFISSNYFAFADFVLNINDYILDIVIGLGFIAICYSALLTWILPAFSNKWEKKDSGENNIQRGIYTVFLIFIFFTTEVEKYDIQKTSDSGSYETYIELKQNRAQNMVQTLSFLFNEWNDKIVKIAIQSNASALQSQAGLLDGEQIAYLAAEKASLSKQLEANLTIDKEMCAANYDLFSLEQILKTYRIKTLNKSDEGSEDWEWNVFGQDYISTLKQNPYPKSEREANAMMYNGYKNNESPYNSSRSSGTNGVVKLSAEDKFRTGDYSPLSLSGCYNNKKNAMSADNRIVEIQKELEKAGNVGNQELLLETHRLIQELQWKAYGEWGYWSISTLALVNNISSNLGLVGDLQSMVDKLKDEDNNSNELIAASLKSLSRTGVMMAWFGGYEIARLSNSIKTPLLKSIKKKAETANAPMKIFSIIKNLTSYDATPANRVDLFDIWLSSKFLDLCFKMAPSIVLTVGSLIMLSYIFVYQLVYFIALLFGSLFLASKNQEDKFLEAVKKIANLYIEKVFLIICIVVSGFILSLFTYFEVKIGNDFFNTMEALNMQSSKLTSYLDVFTLVERYIAPYFYYGVCTVGFLIAKTVMIIRLVFFMPGSAVELFGGSSSTKQDYNESMQTIESKTTKI